ncbi:DAK2 domain-containing protein [uncultured Anaerococcus sp.]|uniref:DAK2 domain-containing protein n=1 Tax=uncultured Anaerococcus sp. TaxID=293428 RepID=UPI0026251E4B|nr:DAK2 domain-containing protein [uncultured Anaerococcus sp.]
MREIDANKLHQMIHAAYELLNENKEMVNELNVFPVPDGDTGTNMTMTMKSGLDKVNQTNETSADEIAKSLSQGTLMGARGNSGVILSQLIRGFSKAIKGKSSINISDIPEIFNTANKTAYKAVMKPTEGTILTVSQKMTDKANEAYSEDMKLDQYLYEIIKEGQLALDNTPNQLPVLKEAGVVDSGGQGLILLLRGAFSALNSDIKIEEIDNQKLEAKKELTYELKFELATTEDSYKTIKKSLDSMAADIDESFKEDTLKASLKTDNVNVLIQMLAENGVILNAELTNLKPDLNIIEKKKNQEAKKYGFIAVSRGKGYDAILKSMNIDQIISGGQTMNPSTEDIYNSLEKINADNIIIFPNNKNIIMSAKQAAEIIDKNAIVVETKSIPETFAAMLEFDEESSIEENADAMKEAIADVHVAEISTSIRDTSVGGIEIKKDDYLGILDGNIIASEIKIEDGVSKTIEKALEDYSDLSLVTLYYGEEVDKKEAKSLVKKISKKHKEIDVELVYGGQPVYYYTITLE